MSAKQKSSAGRTEGAELRMLADIAAWLASGIGSEEVLSAVVGSLYRTLGLTDCRIWVRSRAGDRFRPVVPDGRPPVGEEAAAEVAQWLSRRDDRLEPRFSEDQVRIPLVTDGPPLGLLDAVLPEHHAEADRHALIIAANALALWVASTELSEDLASEVAYRTREIDAHRRFTSRIIDSLPVGLYVIDQDYLIQAWNRKRETGTQGISREEAIGRTVFEVLKRQPKALLQEEFDKVFRTGRMEQMDMESTASGDLRFYRISKIPMRLNDDEVTHVITIGEDVTEWKTIHHQLAETEKLAAVGQLAAGVMHELNNPLATIGACVEALTVRLPDALLGNDQALDEYLRIIDSELDRCNAIVDGLLDFSHPRAHAKQVEEVNPIVENALFLIKHHDRFRGINLVRRFGTSLPRIYANPKQLIQVFLALMLNAIDSMDGEGTLTVTTGQNHERADEVMIEFSDTGLGIPRENLGKIFEPFFTTKVTGRGSGLGLSICYGIVQEHRGRIIVHSQVGRGSTFRVYLPTATGVGTVGGEIAEAS